MAITEVTPKINDERLCQIASYCWFPEEVEWLIVHAKTDEGKKKLHDRMMYLHNREEEYSNNL